MIFVYQDARGRFYSEGDYTEMTPHKDVKKSAADVDESTDSLRHHRLAREERAAQQRRASGIYGTSYPGFYTTASCIDPHPALKACAPGSPMTDIAMGDDEFHNGAFYLGANFSFYEGFGRTPRNPTLGPDPRYDRPPAGKRRLQVLPRHGSARAGHAQVPASRDGAVVESRARAPELRRVLAGAEHPAAPEERRARDAGDRRVLRRRGSCSVRSEPSARSRNSLAARATPATIWRSAHGRTAAGRAATAMRSFTLHWHQRPGRGSATRSSSRSSCTISPAGPIRSLPKVLIFRTGAERWDRYDDVPAEVRREALAVSRCRAAKLAFTRACRRRAARGTKRSTST